MYKILLHLIEVEIIFIPFSPTSPSVSGSAVIVQVKINTPSATEKVVIISKITNITVVIMACFSSVKNMIVCIGIFTGE